MDLGFFVFERVDDFLFELRKVWGFEVLVVD